MRVGAGGTSRAAGNYTGRPPYDICQRAGAFADRCIQVALGLPNNGVAWELQKQLARSGGSVGANLAERKGVLTKAEFSYKVSVALREAHEALYWLKRIANGGLMPRERLEPLMDEADEMVRILTTMLKTARGQQR